MTNLCYRCCRVLPLAVMFLVVNHDFGGPGERRSVCEDCLRVTDRVLDPPANEDIEED